MLIHAGKGIDKEAMHKFEDLNLEYFRSRLLSKVKILDCIELNKEINDEIICENKLIYGNKKNRDELEVIEKININNEVSGKTRNMNIKE